MTVLRRFLTGGASLLLLSLALPSCSRDAGPPAVASVEVTPASTTLVPGQTSALTAVARDASGGTITGQPVTWVSSNAAVASVSSTGVVTAVSDGLASISATIGGRAGGAAVQVRTPVASVSVTPATLTLAPGANASLTATPRDASGKAIAGRAVQWGSSNVAIASVSADGVVTAVTDGTATLTATVEGQSGTASLVVRTPVAAVVVTPASAQLLVGGAPAQLTAVARSASGAALAGRTITWSSANISVATATQTGLVTAVAAGTAIVSATSEGVSGTASIQVLVDPCTVIRPVTFGQTITASLSAADCRLPDKTVVQQFEFTLATRTTVELLMSSSAVDAYLYLLNSTGDVLDEDDDSGGGSNARILTTLAAGRYIVATNTYNANEYGSFQLTVRPAPVACATGRVVTLPFALSTTLQSTACRLNDDSYEDRYDLTITASTTLHVGMTSSVIDPYLVVVDSLDRVVAQDDDGGVGNNASLDVPLTPGRYVILASGYPRETGAYRLDVSAITDPCVVTRSIAPGQVVNSTLATTDCALSDGSGGPQYFLQRFRLTLDVATPLQFDLTSSAIDAYLLIQNAQTGDVIADNDDASVGTTNSRIVISLPAGQYTVNATSYDPGRVGAFQLTVNRIASATFTMTSTPPAVTLLPGQTQQGAVTVSGTSNNTVTWSSTFASVASVSSTGFIRALTPGFATIVATSVVDPSRTATIAVTVSQSTTTVNLDIAAMYVVQVVQQQDSRVPLVADRNAVARVFVRGSRTGIGNVPVRLRLYQGGAVIGTFQGTATPTLTLDEFCCSADIPLPATMIKPGLSVLADVDPANALAELNEADNQFPLTGTPLALSVTTTPAYNVRLIPVGQNRNGQVATGSAALLNVFRAMWPVNTVNLTTRQSVTIDYVIGTQTFDDWSRLVRDVEFLRRADGSNATYYGLVRTKGNSGVLGLANGIPALSAIGVDEGSDFGVTQSRLTIAHELGHTLGLRHAPCGGAAGPDPNYPYTDGRTGVFGMDTFNGTAIKQPNTKDVMTYCDNQWVSAYNYRKVMDFRQANPNGAALQAPTSVLMISGSLRAGAMELDAAFALDAPADKSDPSGRLVLEGFSADGRQLFSWRFTPHRVNDAEPDAEAFVVAVPLSAKVQEQVARVTVREPGTARSAVRMKLRPGSAQAGGATGIVSTRAATGETRMTWSTTEHPMLLVRDRATREIIGIGRTGSMSLTQFGALERIELLLSDGVSSTTHTVDPLTGAIRR